MEKTRSWSNEDKVTRARGRGQGRGRGKGRGGEGRGSFDWSEWGSGGGSTRKPRRPVSKRSTVTVLRSRRFCLSVVSHIVRDIVARILFTCARVRVNVTSPLRTLLLSPPSSDEGDEVIAKLRPAAFSSQKHGPAWCYFRFDRLLAVRPRRRLR